MEDIYSFPYELDVFQKDAMYAITRGENVLVTAHTGSGKSAIAEFAIAFAQKQNKKAIYTAPIKALSNQKYGDFQKKFSGSEVGISTGDIKVTPSAQILVATTEIVLNLLYEDMEQFENVSTVILDEVHYISSFVGGERAHVWADLITHMPKHVSLVMLSATIPGAEKICSWVEKIKGKPCQLISNEKRPIPLEFNVYLETECKKLFDTDNKNLNCKVYSETFKKWQEEVKKPMRDKVSTTKKLNDFCHYLETTERLPCMFFNFSRKQSEIMARMIKRPLIDGKEQATGLNKYDYYIRKYLGEGGFQIPQIWLVRDMLQKGVAIHHSGLMPIVKEIVETLFEQRLIQIMFVTESMSVGINMPTKCVVFGDLNKFDGNKQRLLYPQEFTQMSGRAGRRGLDVMGTVIYFPLTKNMIRLGEFQELLKPQASLKLTHEIDPLFILQCARNDLDPEIYIQESLLANEVSTELAGIDKEIECTLKKIPETLKEDEALFTKLHELSTMQSKNKKQRMTIIREMNEIRDTLGKSKMMQLELAQKERKTMRQLEESKDDLTQYIKNTIAFHRNVLCGNGYINKDKTLTLRGRGCTCIQEMDSFLGMYYLEQDIEKYTKMELCFLLGALVNDKECIRFEEEGELCMDTMIQMLCESKEEGRHVLEIVEMLKRLYNDALNKGLLRNESTNISVIFGGYVYLWVKGYNYPAILREIGVPIFEGNFVKNMLKVNNIIGEFIQVCELHQRFELVEKFTQIRASLIRDICIQESLYVMPA